MNRKEIETLKNDPKNRFMQEANLTDIDSNQLTAEEKQKLYLYEKYTLDPAIVIERFLQLRLAFVKCLQQHPDWTDHQAKQYAMREHPEWRTTFCERYTRISAFVFDRKTTNEQISKLFKVMRTALKNNHKQNRVWTEKELETRISSDHPHFKEIANPQNQIFLQQLFQSGLVKLPSM